MMSITAQPLVQSREFLREAAQQRLTLLSHIKEQGRKLQSWSARCKSK
jgi:hypothetical protein